jgi:nicotinic acid mononucleotide adenylyltransferase
MTFTVSSNNSINITNNNSVKIIPSVIVSTGTFSPVTRMHIRSFEIAKQSIESYITRDAPLVRYKVIAGYASPTHDSYCQRKLGPDKAIHSTHRISMMNLAIKEAQMDDWLSVCEHHTKLDHMIDINDEILHIHEMIHHQMSTTTTNKIQIFFLCGSDLARKLKDWDFPFEKYGLFIIQRNDARITRECLPPPASASSPTQSNRNRNPVILIDHPPEYTHMRGFSSSLLRNLLENNKLIDGITFNSVQGYMIEFDILDARQHLMQQQFIQQLPENANETETEKENRKKKNIISHI